MTEADLLIHEIESNNLSRKIDILQEFAIGELASIQFKEKMFKEQKQYEKGMLAKESYNNLYIISSILKDIGFKASSIECDTEVYKKALNYNADQSK